MSEQGHNRFDDLLRQRMQDVRFEPSASLKAKVEADFMRSRRRRFFWWFFSGFGVVSLATFLILYSTETNLKLSTEFGQDSPDVAMNMKPVGDADSANPDESPTSSNNSAEEKTSEEPIITEETNPVESPEQTQSIPKRAENTKSVFPEKNIVSKSTESSGPSVKKISQSESQSYRDARSDYASNSDKNDVADTDAGKQKPVLDLTGMSLLPPSSAENKEKTNTILIGGHPYDFEGDVFEPDFQTDCNRILLGFSGGIGLSYRTLHSDVHHQLVDHKNQSEHSTISQSFGITSSIPLFRTTGIKTGLTYLRVGERYHFENDHAAHATTNYYDYFNLDLKVNQMVVCKNRLRVDIAAGTKFNLLNNAESSWLDPNTFEPVLHNDEGEASPFRTYNLVWSAEISGYYFVTQKVYLGLTFEADRFQNSIYKNEVQLDQRPYAFQGYLDIGYKF